MNMPPEQVDVALGSVLRLHRKAAGLSQFELGKAAGISFQQIQKYESGQNRVSISRLFELADALNLEPVAMIAETQDIVASNYDGGQATDPTKLEFMASKKGRRVIEAVMALEDKNLLDAITHLVTAATQSDKDLVEANALAGSKVRTRPLNSN